ncbi:MAG: replication endonuclease [Colwellia sp.]|nr:replication endonuclease [Colwellia sp.]
MSDKLFRMPRTLGHFHDKDHSYISLYAKGLFESCSKVTSNDYTVVFGRWTDYFVPNDIKKAKVYFEDWANIKKKLNALVDEDIFEDDRKHGRIGIRANSHYVSERILLRREQQLLSHESFLGKHFNTNSTDISKLEIVTKQAKRFFAEKYNFCVGIEEYARDLGYHCLFLTMTVPSRMHANPTNNNSSWDGTTVKQAKDYLVNKWKKFTNDLSRKKHNIKMSKGDLFGVRVIEAHKSGSPHMHVLLYTSPELINKSIPTLLKKHFGDTSQALTMSHFSLEDKKSSPPTSYIVKHLAGAESSSSNLSHKEKAKRLDAWKSALRIRTFQSFGKTAPISQWRLFRKFFTKFYNEELTMLPETEKARIEEFKANGVTALGYRTMLATKKPDVGKGENLRRQFTDFIHALKNLESTGHQVLIKETYENRYGKEKYKVIGIDIGFIKFIF